MLRVERGAESWSKTGLQRKINRVKGIATLKQIFRTDEHKTTTKLHKETTPNIKYQKKKAAALDTVEWKSESKGKDLKTDLIIQCENPEEISQISRSNRSQIALPFDSELTTKAKQLAKKIIPKLKSQKLISVENFRQLYNQTIQESNIGDDSESLFYHTALLCVKSKTRPRAPLKSLPSGFWGINESSSFADKIRVLGRYILTEEHQIKTAADLESIQKLKDKFSTSGLNLNSYIGLLDTLKVIYPGYLSGDCPIVRAWRIPNLLQIGKPDLESIPPIFSQALRTSFLEQNGVLDQEGSYNNEKIKSINWTEVFHKPGNGTRSIVETSGCFKGTLSALKLAAPGLIGTNPGQIPPWQFKRIGFRWSGEEGKEACQLMTRYIFRAEGLLDNQNKPIPIRVQKWEEQSKTTWAERFKRENAQALQLSGYGDHWRAIQATFPDSIGWNRNQINPGDIDFDSKWVGRTGKALFKFRFAKKLEGLFNRLKINGEKAFQQHTVKFQPNKSPILNITSSDMKALRIFMRSNEIKWEILLDFFGMKLPFKDHCSNNKVKLFTLLLGKIDPTTGCFGKSGLRAEDLNESINAKNLLSEELKSEMEEEAPSLYPTLKKGQAESLIRDLKTMTQRGSPLFKATVKCFALSRIGEKKVSLDKLLQDASINKQGLTAFKNFLKTLDGLIKVSSCPETDRTKLHNLISKLDALSKQGINIAKFLSEESRKHKGKGNSLFKSFRSLAEDTFKLMNSYNRNIRKLIRSIDSTKPQAG